MGLHVSVYKNVKKSKNINDLDRFKAHVIDDSWRYKIKNLECGVWYKGRVSNLHVWYPYSRHMDFRIALLKMIGRSDLLIDNRIDWDRVKKQAKMPFYELINYADNDGCLDWEISNILYTNFVEWKDATMEFSDKKLFGDDEDYFSNKYMDWLKVFAEGKNVGNVVVFS